MKKIGIIIITIFGILLPTLSYADEPGVIGYNMGLDFYSRIDDAGDALAQGIAKRRITDKGNYGSLGCGSPWIKDMKINQDILEELKIGNTAVLVMMANSKNVILTTESELSLRNCLVEKYNAIQRAAYQDQKTLEVVGNVGIYMDGDMINSDYDIISDISRINTIIFKDRYDYAGTKNATSKSIADMLAGKPIAPLFSGTGSSSGSITPTATGSLSGAISFPWAGTCSDSASLFGDGFFDDLNTTLISGTVGDGLSYTARGIVVGSSGTTSSGAFGVSEKKDFYHKPTCDGIFCITVDMVGNQFNLLGGYNNAAIESLLEKHLKMMEPISWSDLSAQSMTRNYYQLPFLNIKIADKIAGLRTYISDSPQQVRNLESEATQLVKDAKFDADFRCAMNQVGLSGDPILTNGFIGEGYTGLKYTTIVPEKTLPLGPQEMENLSGCYETRMGAGKLEANKGLSTDLTEIQAFTRAMIDIIYEILQVDRKLDKLPTK